MPLAADFRYVLRGREADFQAGLDALAKMAKTYLGVSSKQTATALTAAKNVEINFFDRTGAGRKRRRANQPHFSYKQG